MNNKVALSSSKYCKSSYIVKYSNKIQVYAYIPVASKQYLPCARLHNIVLKLTKMCNQIQTLTKTNKSYNRLY